MGDVIKLLPESVYNQIAAGEVVQRPASVIKELVENAIDAGATSVTVNIKDGGKELIQVVDNGCGMSATDSVKAFERHATSKISSAEDLYRLSTFGFRGEALASIASVAEVEMRTRKCEEEIGTQVIINGGDFVSQTPVNTPKGTQFFIKNLFYNIPARRKFLKSNSAETKHILSEFIRVAMCNPSVEMILYNNNTCIYNLPASGLRNRIASVVGKNIKNSLLDLSVKTSIIDIEGFITSPQSAKKSGAEQYLFVNDRFFRSPYFNKAVLQAYDNLINNDTQPSYFLYFTIDPSRIDVNISPAKTEIKFEDEQAIWQIINAAVRESLGKYGAIPMMDFDSDTSVEIPVYDSSKELREPVNYINPEFNPFEQEEPLAERSVKKTSGRSGYLDSMSFGRDIPEGWEILYKDNYDDFDKSSTEGDTFRSLIDEEEEEYISNGFGSDNVVQESLEIESSMQSDYEYIRISNRYVAVSRGRSLLLVDLPRAHRRIKYEEIISLADTGTSISQQELFPEPCSLSVRDIALLQSHRAELLDMGFEMMFGETDVVLRTIPVVLESLSPYDIVGALVENFADGLDNKAGIKDIFAVKMANLYSLNRRRNMQDEEIKDLLSSLFECREPKYTPDGKRVYTTIDEQEIIKRLK
ncbi:MAG: DNA mismatch repair endonuclease MutL [Rikenellaceae bacterium]|nr:DNA mismatch repair endonuclease MutL [Rikenellaceae bacterium]